MGEIKGIEITDVLGLKEPLSKLIECIGCGVGKVYEPTHIKRMAKAKAEEIKLIGEAVTDNLSLPTKYVGGEVSIDSTSVEELMKRTGNRMLFREMKKQQNIESVIAKTYMQLENEEGVSAEPVNEDWLFKFFDFVGDISDEQMQLLWSKVLTGEIKKPNTYSLRTLNTLRNITQSEAITFQKVSKFKLIESENPFIINDVALLKKYDCNFGDLLAIEDCGLINLNGFVSMNFEEGRHAIYTDKIIAIIDNNLKLLVYKFTESGKQILNLLENDTNFDYTVEVLKNLKDKNNKIKAYRITEKNEQNITYDDTKDLLIENNEN